MTLKTSYLRYYMTLSAIAHISVESKMEGGSHLGFVDYRTLQSKYRCHHRIQHGRNPPHLDIIHGHSNRFIWHWFICPNSTQNWAVGPLYRAKWPPGGIFALGNMCFHKPGSDRDLWVPLKFCHQGGAWGPLLPTRLKLVRLVNTAQFRGESGGHLMWSKIRTVLYH